VTWDESHVSIGDLLGVIELGLDSDEDSPFSGAECELKDKAKHGVDCAIE